MKVKALMPARLLNLVAPLAHKATAMHTKVTTSYSWAWPCAVAPLIGPGLRWVDVDSAHRRSTRATTPGIRTSAMATRTTTTRTTSFAREPSADPHAACTLEEVVAAYMDCRTNKRNTASALAFEERRERNLYALFERLRDGTYTPGRSNCFVITRPKAREVWAAEFPDRIVHHLLYNKVAARFHASFIADSCACIPGRGTLYASERLESKVRSVTHNWARPAWYLKCDLANFFVAIDKHVLRAQLAKRIHEPWWLWLADVILFHDPRLSVNMRGPASLLARVPAHKSLFNAPEHRGLPIGNLSSQFFANVHLDALDQFVKHQLKARHYIRYVDDFLLLHESRDWLVQALAGIDTFLPAQLGARLNPRKTIIQPISRGVDFVGHVLKPWHTTTRRRTVATAIERTRHAEACDLVSKANSYFGLLGQANSSHADRARLARAVLQRGHCVNQSFTQTYPSERTTHHGF
jgi:RNA-directed DNA polymerase